MNKWQPIETAPKDGTVILVANSDEVVAAIWNPEEPKFQWSFLDDITIHDEGGIHLNGYQEKHLTHWMPLPEPPEQTS